MDRKELERQYSPSCWSVRYQNPDDVIAKHVELAKRESEEARLKVPVECEVHYGPGFSQQLDIFGGKSIPDDAPIFVYIHGGYWQELSRSLSAYCVRPLYDSGIRVVIVGYDLAPAVTVDEIVKEIQEAATYIVNMAATLGSSSVWFSGHSAGAQLASMLLMSGWLEELRHDLRHIVKGFFLISGVFDLTPLVDTYVNDKLNLSREDALALSPLKNALKLTSVQDLQVVLAVGQHDSPEFQRQSKEFAQKLGSLDLRVDFEIVSAVDHFDIVENLQSRNYRLTQKVVELLLQR